MDKDILNILKENLIDSNILPERYKKQVSVVNIESLLKNVDIFLVKEVKLFFFAEKKIFFLTEKKMFFLAKQKILFFAKKKVPSPRTGLTAWRRRRAVSVPISLFWGTTGGLSLSESPPTPLLSDKNDRLVFSCQSLSIRALRRSESIS